ncbi:uncharacterized protein LOC108863975 [Galendromus occidentalis]|uniref:Uncharacterized protein LOC108863975 n=1 Tax=Galendromus occidentalis TaxID=34638 RepID=A0AAJ7L4Z9_9ACAR|nr:uncharacterized protein LOC108863975 [Galendromus occidentalis]
MSDSLKIVKSQRGRNEFSHGGHRHVFDRLSSEHGTEFWRCHFRKSCKIRLHRLVFSGEAVSVSGTHSDPSDAAAVEVAVRRTTLKRHAVESSETPVQFIDSIQQGASSAVQMQFPSKRVLAERLNRAREACASATALPADRSSIIIPDEYPVNHAEPGRSEKSLIGDSGYGVDDRILIFGRESVADWIGFVDEIYVDGTFTVAPTLFQQVLVVLAKRFGSVSPICYALLPDKSQATYSRMIELLRTAWPQFNPTPVSLDSELGLINAFENSFPNARKDACLSHRVKDMKLKLVELGLMERFDRDDDSAL